MRLDPGLRAGTYAAFATLFLSGAAWLLADALKDSPNGEWWQAASATMLMIHGGTAMVALMLLGALIPLHALRSWRAARNRSSGAVNGTCNAVLVLTAFGLYYGGSDLLRTVASDLHIAVGLGLPLLIASHVVLGRRSRKPAAANLPQA